MSQTLSVITPCYNEGSLIEKVIERVFAVQLPDGLMRQLVIVDDCSTDQTRQVIDATIEKNPHWEIILKVHPFNTGKGAAIRTGIHACTGNYIIIQDADHEYDPAEYSKLLKPMLDGHADVVYGSRFRGSEAHRVLFFLHSAGNKMLTFLSNLFTGMNLTDMETGYKLFRSEILKSLRLKENRFGFEPEVTARISKIKGIRVYEVGISYYGRSYAEGKKIRWVDGFRALYCILRYNLFSK